MGVDQVGLQAVPSAILFNSSIFLDCSNAFDSSMRPDVLRVISH